MILKGNLILTSLTSVIRVKLHTDSGGHGSHLTRSEEALNHWCQERKEKMHLSVLLKAQGTLFANWFTLWGKEA